MFFRCKGLNLRYKEKLIRSFFVSMYKIGLKPFKTTPLHDHICYLQLAERLNDDGTIIRKER